jgi:hypothetical protein
MITENRNDGTGFRLTIEFTDFENTNEEYIVYGEDFDECLQEGLKRKIIIENSGLYVIDFRIQDDSK